VTEQVADDGRVEITFNVVGQVVVGRGVADAGVTPASASEFDAGGGRLLDDKQLLGVGEHGASGTSLILAIEATGDLRVAMAASGGVLELGDADRADTRSAFGATPAVLRSVGSAAICANGGLVQGVERAFGAGGLTRQGVRIHEILEVLAEEIGREVVLLRHAIAARVIRVVNAVVKLAIPVFVEAFVTVFRGVALFGLDDGGFEGCVPFGKGHCELSVPSVVLGHERVLLVLRAERLSAAPPYWIWYWYG